jgi:hypothetical protein
MTDPTDVPRLTKAQLRELIAAQAQSGADSGAATEATKPTHQDEETH